ncbi:annexin A8 [Cricetulus griseus]
MKDHSPQVSHSVNLMLLLLILSMPLVAVHSFLYPRSDQHDYHENSDTFLDYEDWDSRKTMEEEAEETLQYCDGDFDVYFIFDKSKAVEEWADMFTAWEDMVEKYVNPNLRMSFILFDSKATVQMALTSDRKKIRQELSNVEILQIHGPAILYRGLEKEAEEWGPPGLPVVDSIEPAAPSSVLLFTSLSATTRISLIIIAIWGTPSAGVWKSSKREIGTLTCFELRYVEPLCIEDNSPVILKGYGFHNAKNINQVICRFKFSDSKVITRSFRYRGPGWKLLHRLGNTFPAFHQRQIKRMKQNLSQRQSGEDCQGVFDLYIILDNPKMRMSIIIYSTFAEVITPLTSDREAIRKGLEKLNDEVPEGFTHMQDGFQKVQTAVATSGHWVLSVEYHWGYFIMSPIFFFISWQANEQIRKATSEGSNINSVIIAMTDGLLLDKHLKLTVEEANKSRQMGATIFTVGVYKYDAKQMLQIADSPYHNFEVKKGFTALNNIVDGVEQEGVTVKGSSHFNPDPDAETLYKAMKGIGTNEQAIIDVLTKRSNVQRQQIAKSFKAQFGKDLTETLKSELSGKFERLIVALMYPPYKYEAKELHDAMKGLGTKEGVIIEILASRTKNQLREIMKAYEEDYGSNLEEDIQADTSGYLERILVCLLQDLYAAGEKIHGTDEMKFITILCTRSATHLMRVFEEYEKIANKSIEDSIKSETHGSLEEAMLTVVKCTRNLHSYFAERLHYAMKGAGTRDGTLIRNIVSRSEIDLNLIKGQFQKMYGKTLSSMIMGDTSGDYKNALLNLVGSDP